MNFLFIHTEVWESLTRNNYTNWLKQNNFDYRIMVDLKPQELPRWNLKLAPIPRRQRETEERGRPSRSVGSRFHDIQILSWAATRQGPYTGPSNLQFLQRPSWGSASRLMSSADVLNATSLSQGSVLAAPSGSREGKYKPYSKDRGGVRSLRVPRPSSQVNRVLLMTLP